MSYLFVVCFFDLWKYFMRADKHPEYLAGLVVVPILLLGKIFLGIYYNLSIWYKVTNKTMIGAYITIGGAIITLLINLFFIKEYGFIACAWASFACYGFMMVVSYLVGQQYYPVPYQIGRIGLYIGVMLMVFILNKYGSSLLDTASYRIGWGIICLMIYGVFALFMERKEFAKLPVVGKIFK
jgi:O-antigen/teichoic acid export membrane protein